jgi:hypothetical protein
MAKKRAFISFDFDNDKVLKDFIVGQARNADAPFEIVDTSLKEAAPMKTWEDKARAAVKSESCCKHGSGVSRIRRLGRSPLGAWFRAPLGAVAGGCARSR